MAASDVLVLGCVDAGKTSLMRRLAGGAGASFNSVLDTAPTVRENMRMARCASGTSGANEAVARTCVQTGVELDTIAVGGAAEKDARTVSAREIGSAMRPMWHSYYKGAKSVLVSGLSLLPKLQRTQLPARVAAKLTSAPRVSRPAVLHRYVGICMLG